MAKRELLNRDRPQPRKKRQPSSPPRAADTKGYELRLYVAGQTPNSLLAFANLKRICEEHLNGKYHLEVIDLLANPQLAKGDQIFAIPTLVRKLPTPVKRLIGDMSNTVKVLVGLDIRPSSTGEQS